MPHQHSSVNASEIENFSKLAAAWWDETGAHKVLHQLNPVRLTFIRETIMQHFSRSLHKCSSSGLPLEGLKILDIGCGGGLVTEPLTRLGATVTGIDADGESIAVAIKHAKTMGLTIDYNNTTAEALTDIGARYDVVLALEIIEHVADVAGFLASCCKLVAHQGILILSTINRTYKSWALAIAGAEYILQWVPRGTHNWQQFLTPAEIANGLRGCGFMPQQVRGLTYSPWPWSKNHWQLSSDIDINYFLTAVHYG